MRSRQRATRRLGVTLMFGSLAAMVALVGPAAAQDEPEPIPVPIDEMALYTAPVTDVIPPTLKASFPPQVVCVLQPQFCAEDTQEIRDALTGLINQVDENATSLPVQPVPPDSIAVSFLGGAKRYQTAVKFALPDVPEGEVVDSFVLTLPQRHPSYSVESPAFRKAVAAAIAGVASQDPEAFAAEFQKALEEEPLAQPVVGIEACPLTKPFEPAPPPQSAPDSEMPSEEVDGSPEPAVDCLSGANGVFDEETGDWSFDLTFAMEAWQDGTFDNHGILLRPTGGTNLAFGDPDPSTNAQVLLDVAEPAKATMATSPPPAPLEPLAPPEPTTPAPAPTTPAPATTAPAAPSGTSGGGSSGEGSFVNTADPVAGEDDVEEPAVAAPEPNEPPPAGDEPLAQEPISAPGEPLYVWLLVPVFLGGAFLLARSLNEPLPVEAARSGALTKLLEAQGA